MPSDTSRAARRPLGLFAMAVAFLLPVVFSPSTHSGFWAPKASLLPLVAAVGLPQLVGHLRAGSPTRRPAVAATAFLAVAALSAALAETTTIAVFGAYGLGTGLLFVAALVGAWAIGAALDDAERADVGRAFLLAVLVNAAVALLSLVVDLGRLDLGLFEGRATGLVGNPIHLGAVCAAGLALLVPRLRTGRTLVIAVLVAAVAAAAEVSGSRSGVVAGALVVLWGVLRLPRRLGAVLVVSAALGLAGGWLLAEVGGGVSVSSRVVAEAGGGGLTPRLSQWWSTRSAVADHPLLGSGPGTYREATSRYRTERVARAFGAERYFADAHNLVVEYVTTTGVLGVAAFLAWIVLSATRARGAFAVGAGAILLVGLVEPQWAATTPIALLLLGAAGPVVERRSTVAATAVLAVPAVVAGGVLLVGDFHLDQVRLDFDRAHAREALRLLPRWPEPALLRARIDVFEGRSEADQRKLAVARSWLVEGVERDPTNPSSWLTLADFQLSTGRPAEAALAYEQALRFNPQSVRARTGREEAGSVEPASSVSQGSP